MLLSSSLLGGWDQETGRRDTDPTEPSEALGGGGGVPSVGSSTEWQFQAQISDQHIKKCKMSANYYWGQVVFDICILMVYVMNWIFPLKDLNFGSFVLTQLL